MPVVSANRFSADDYRELLDVIDGEPWPDRPYHGFAEFLDSCPDHLPGSPPACTYECYRLDNGFYFKLYGKSRSWHAGDPAFALEGEAFELDRESAACISRLCHILRCPPMYSGIFGLHDLWMFLEGMGEALPRDPFKTPAVKTLVRDAWSDLLAQFDFEDVWSLVSSSSGPEAEGDDLVRRWRKAFRESLLFRHPEIGLSYAAYMGCSNLYCFKELVEKGWRW